MAIARALVNNPDIILADEPTGALDTETSVQVMEILKKVASDRLVIMVTHNPELAERYSTRIIRMLDGNITDDSAPLTKEEVAAEMKKQAEKTEAGKLKKHKKPSMSMRTAFGLSLKNLFTKKGRTMLTSFAGSIGIIGIALIYAVSQGMTTYIDALQEDTLSSYPLTIEAQHLDTGSLLETFIGSATSGGEHENDAVYEKGMLYKMINSLNTMETDENDLKAFKEYIETERAKGDDGSGDGETSLAEALSGVQYTYDMDMQIYTESVDGTIIQSDTQELLQELMLEYFGLDMSSMTSLGDSYGMSDMMESMSGMSGMSGTSAVLWQEMLPGNDGELISPLLEKQYDVIYGSWPSAYNEVVLVVDENNEIDDMTLYALGLKSKDEIDELAQAAIDQTGIAEPEEKWTYEDICNMEFRTIFASDCYTYDEQTGLYTDLRDSQAGMKYLYDNGVPLKVSGIIRPNEDSVSSMLSGTIGYTSALTEYVIENSKGSEAVNAQLADPSTDIFTGLPFSENTGNLTDEEKAQEFEDYIAQLGEEEKAGAYVEMMSIPSEEELYDMVGQAVGSKTRADIESDMTQALVQQMGMAESEVADYLAEMSDEDLNDLYTQMVEEQVKAQYAQQVSEELGSMDTAQLAAALEAAMPEYSTEQLAVYHDEILEFSDSSYENNLRELGVVDIDSPSSINLYASTFENKDVIEEAIDAYNEGADELEQITYTDYVGLMMSSVTAIINAITYVLIAFVAISLIVSSIMIGVITLISVQERTKEIGILRAIGASKKNVSHMFNAETVIIGFASGTLGVIITDLLCIPINELLHHLTGINNLNAYLPWQAALILIGISVLLTLISGIIPSRSAAKKDPVVALRSE